MARSGKLLAFLGAAALLSSCAATSVQQLAQDKWVEARSTHFQVLTNASPAKAEALLREMEMFRAAVLATSPFATDEQGLPFRLIAVQGGSGLRTILPNYSQFGAFQATLRGGLAMIDLGARGPDGTAELDIIQTPFGPQYRVRRGSRVISLEAVFHEYVHALLANDRSRRYPLWFNEGYADYLSTLQLEGDNAVRIGVAPVYRRLAPKPAHHSIRPKYYWIPLEVMLRTKGYETGHGQGDLYGQAWAMVHYLMRDTETAAKLPTYLKVVSNGGDPVASFERVFGMLLDDFRGNVRSYINRDDYPSTKIAVVLPDDIQFTQRAVPESEMLTRLAEATLVFQGDIPRTAGLLEQALTLDPGNIEARALWSSMALFTPDLAVAAQRLEGARDIQGAAFITAAHGHLELQRTVDLYVAKDEGWRDSLRKTRTFYEQAVATDPQLADAWAGLARSYIFEPEPGPRAFEAVAKAQELVPTHYDLDMLLGHFHMRHNRVQQAVYHFNQVVAWSRSPDTVTRARVILDEIAALTRTPEDTSTAE